MTTRKEAAQARLKAASEHVEAAQHEIERAISALGALAWMSSEQTKLGVLRDRIHEAFYRLAPISHVRAKACAKAELDREPEAGDEDRHKGCCAGYAIPEAVRRYAEKAPPRRAASPESLAVRMHARSVDGHRACLRAGAAMSANLSIHVPQDRDESTGALFSGLDVDFWTAFPEAVSVSCDDANGDPGPLVNRITLAQAAQLRDALDEVLRAALPEA